MDKKIPQHILDRLEFTKPKDGEIAHVKRVRHSPRPCEDCGRVVENRTIRISISQSASTHRHIKRQCKICGFYYNDETGCYDATFNDINNRFKKRKNTSSDK